MSKEAVRKILEAIQAGRLDSQQGKQQIQALLKKTTPAGEEPSLSGPSVNGQAADFKQFDNFAAPGLSRDMAVIGMACRFPGADGLASFWKNLVQGRDCVTEIPAERWSLSGFYSPDPEERDKSYSKWGGFISDLFAFDLDFFSLKQQEVLAMDPQHLLALEVAWQALEDAGYNDKNKRQNRETAVFFGARSSETNYQSLLEGRPVSMAENRSRLLGTAQNMIASRISDWFDLTGPSLTIDTACSSSLVALHTACQSIQNNDCQMALVGGVDLLIDREDYIGLSRARAISPQGRCFTFDIRANGYTPGEGAGVLVIKSTSQALADGDRIYAIIKGSAVNNDGHTMGLTTPDLQGQKKVIQKALQNAGVRGNSISYIETHGTGTTIGDPIEIKALTEIYRQSSQEHAYCGLGTVKTNIGHLHSAAGIAAAIKTVLCLYYQRLVPSLHCHEPNPRFSLEHTPFYLVQHNQAWEPLAGRQRAGISSFGFGGTNCHLIMEAYQSKSVVVRESSSDCLPHLLIFSAHDQPAWQKICRNYIDFLQTDQTIDLSDLAISLADGRARLPYGQTFLVRQVDELLALLKESEQQLPGLSNQKQPQKKVSLFLSLIDELDYHDFQVFLDQCPVFEQAFQYCESLLSSQLKHALRYYLKEEYKNRIRLPLIQAGLSIAFAYACSQLLEQLGLEIDVIYGQGWGILGGLVISGAFSLEQALQLPIDLDTQAGVLKSLAAEMVCDPLLPVYYYDNGQCQAMTRQSVFSEPIRFPDRAPRDLDVSGLPDQGQAVLFLAQKPGPDEPPRHFISLLEPEQAIYTGWCCLVSRLLEKGYLLSPLPLLRQGQKLSLPAYPFSRQPLGHKRKKSGRRYWQRQCCLTDFVYKQTETEIEIVKTFIINDEPLFNEHQVSGQAVLPAVAQWTMAIAAIVSAVDQPVRLTEVLHHAPLTAGYQKVCQVRLSYDFESHDFKIWSWSPDQKEWLCHARGRIRQLSPADQEEALFSQEQPNRPALADLKKRLNTAFSGQPDFYRALKRRGLSYGDRYQSVQSLFSRDNEALVRVDTRDQTAACVYAFDHYPPLLDGIFHAVSALLPAGDNTTYVPFFTEEVILSGSLPADCYGHISLEKKDPANVIRAHAVIYTESGQVIGRIQGFTLKKMHRLSLPDQTLKSLFFTPKWLETAVPKASKTIWHDKKVLLFYQPNLAEQVELGRLIAKQAKQVILVAPGPGYEKKAAQSYGINPGVKSDYEKLGRELAAAPDRIDYVIHLWTFTPAREAVTAVEQLEDGLKPGLYSLIFLIQALQQVKLLTGLRLEVLSSSSQVVIEQDQHLEPERGALQGVINTIPLEYEQWQAFHCDLAWQFNGAGHVLTLLEQELSVPAGSKTQFSAYRENRRYIRQIVPFEHEKATDQPSLELKEQGIYLIIGGLSGVGLQIARRLADEPGRTLIVAGQTPIPSQSGWPSLLESQMHSPDPSRHRQVEKIKNLIELQERGAAVKAYTVDLTDTVSVKTFIQKVQKDYPHINGIIHSAGVLRDGLLCNLTEEEIKAVITPKIQGTWLLDHGFSSCNFDWMLLFSGLVTYVGIMGQANHAAADFYQDHYAQSARRNKQPIYTINWGIWDDIGSVADDYHISSLKKRGFHALSPSKACAAFFKALALGKVQIGIGEIDASNQDIVWPEIRSQAHSNPDQEHSLLAVLREQALFIERTMADRDWKMEHLFSKQIASLSAAFILEYFSRYAIFSSNKQGITKSDILRRTMLRKDFHLLLDSMLKTLLNMDLITLKADHYYRTEKSCVSFSQASARMKECLPGTVQVYARLLEQCRGQYHEVLSGVLNPMQLLFPPGRENLLEALYAIPSPHYQVAARLIAALKPVNDQQAKHILEIGSGTGSLTRAVLPLIKDQAYTYTFTDLSMVFLNNGRKNFASLCSHYALLDIGKDPLQQGFTAQSYDLIIAANVLHATSSLTETFSYVKSLLKPGGYLVMLETTRCIAFADLIFGITDGWWKFDQACRLRSDSALLSAEQWEKHLIHSLGFKLALALPGGEHKSDLFPYSVIVAQSEQSGLPVSSPKQEPARAGAIDHKQITATADRAAKPGIARPETERAVTDLTDPVQLLSSIKEFLQVLIADLLQSAKESISPREGFLELGIDSLSLVTLAGQMEETLGIKLYPTLFFEYQSIEELAEYLLEREKNAFIDYFRDNQVPDNPVKPGQVDPGQYASPQPVIPARAEPPALETEAIAIIGMAGIFPRADNIDQYWHNVVTARDCISEIDASRWDTARFFQPGTRQAGKTYCKWAGLINEIAGFDAAFFKISPKEARLMDPQQRLFLEVAHHAFEDAGYGGKRLYGTKTGVFAGVSNHHYFDEAFNPDNGFSVLGTQNGIVANRLSYCMNLCGPCLTIDTQCSSSLVALHLACKSLREGESELAVVGGVNMLVPVKYYILLSQVQVLSPDGRCQTFDKDANGFVSGEGAVVLLLKPLARARADRDPIHGIIKGSAVNHDGRSSHFSAPNARAQSKVIEQAWKNARIDAKQISYIEAHGTGTALGDPVEVAALTQVMRGFSPDNGFCGIGSVKSNIGHLEAASGLAGIVKVLLAMKHRTLPPTRHFKQVNPHLDLLDSPFYVVDQARPWTGEQPRLAGISSFGMGGTNSHVVISEYQAADNQRQQPAEEREERQLFTLSAHSQPSLLQRISDLLDYCRDNKELSGSCLTDLCYTANYCRGDYQKRAAFSIESLPDLSSQLNQALSSLAQAISPSCQEKPAREKLVLLLPDPWTVTFDLTLVKTLKDRSLDWIAEQPVVQTLLDIPAPSRQEQTACQLVFYALLIRLLEQYGLNPARIICLGEAVYLGVIQNGAASFEDVLSALARGDKSCLPSTRIPQGRHYFAYQNRLLRPIHTLDPKQIIAQKPAVDLEHLYKDQLKPDQTLLIMHSLTPEPSAVEQEPDPVISLAGENNRLTLQSFQIGLARLYEQGYVFDWQKFYACQKTRLLSLPYYPFDHAHYWYTSEQADRPGSRSKLFQPYSLAGKKRLANRIVRCAVELARADDKGCITPNYLDYSKRWSNQGIGLQIGANFIVSTAGRTSDKDVVLPANEIDLIKQVVQLGKAGGTCYLMQLNYKHYHSQLDLEVISRDFIRAAALAKASGADGIQLHAANGYFLSQLISDPEITTVEKLRFLESIITAIQHQSAADFIISIKLDTPFSKMSTVSESGMIAIARQLADRSIDLIEFSGGIAFQKEDHLFYEFLKRAQAQINCVIFGSYGLRSQVRMQELLDQHSFELVGLGRPFIAEPGLALDLAGSDGSWQAACTSCNGCFMQLPEQPLQCIVCEKEENSAFCFQQQWEPVARDNLPGPEHLILLGAESESIKHLAAGLRKRGCFVSLLILKENYAARERDYIEINAYNPAHYQQALSDLAPLNGPPVSLVYCNTLKQTSGLDKSGGQLIAAVENYIDEYFYLGKGLLSHHHPLQLILLTFQGQKVQSGEKIDCSQAGLIALNRIMPHEIKYVRTKSIDLAVDGTEESEKIIDILLAEAGGQSFVQQELAYRRGQRYQRKIALWHEKEVVRQKPLLQAGEGTYLLTGGLGGLGYVMAEYLVSQGVKRLIITGRTPLPGETAGPVAEKKQTLTDQRGYDKAAALNKLQSYGSQVVYLSSDITDQSAVTALIKQIISKYNELNGVIHCAGLLDSVNRSLRSKERAGFARITDPKIKGTVLLYEACARLELDFFMLTSSIAAADGKLGAALSDYAAANLFQDYFALAFDSRPAPLISINWPLWQGIGLGSRKAQGEYNFSISRQEGIAILDKIMHCQVPAHLMVMNSSSPNFSLDFFNQQPDCQDFAGQPDIKETSPSQPGPEIKKHKNQAIVKAVHALLERFLDIKPQQVEPDIPFSDYGIDSVIIADMTGALEQQFKIQLHPSVLIQYPDVRRLTAYLLPLVTLPSTGKTDGPGPGLPVPAEENTDQAADESKPLQQLVYSLARGEISVAEAMKKYGADS